MGHPRRPGQRPGVPRGLDRPRRRARRARRAAAGHGPLRAGARRSAGPARPVRRRPRSPRCSPGCPRRSRWRSRRGGRPRCRSRACGRSGACWSSARGTWRWTPAKVPRCSRSPASSSRAMTSRGCSGAPRDGRRPSRSGPSRLADPSASASFGGANRMVAEYLRDEILAGLSAQRRRFLLETSVLETLTGEVCDHVLERAGLRDGAGRALRGRRAAGPARPLG